MDVEQDLHRWDAAAPELTQLAGSPAEEVRAAVAAHGNTPAEVLATLADDPSPDSPHVGGSGERSTTEV